MDLPAFDAVPVTWLLLLVTVAVSVYSFSRPILFDRLAFDVGAILRHKEDDRLITSGFVHGDVMHLLVNMLTLMSFGPALEGILGGPKFLALYLGSMIIASLVMLYAKKHNMTYRAVGASGATCGIVFAFCLFAPFAGLYIFFLPVAVPALLYAVLFVAYSSYAAGGGDGIAHEAHLGGSVGGVVLTILLEPRALASFLGQIGG
ncbi:MAG: rhomboid family intramembrane serine protease [Hyphomicrobiaceae bacterium]